VLDLISEWSPILEFSPHPNPNPNPNQEESRALRRSYIDKAFESDLPQVSKVQPRRGEDDSFDARGETRRRRRRRGGRCATGGAPL